MEIIDNSNLLKTVEKEKDMIEPSAFRLTNCDEFSPVSSLNSCTSMADNSNYDGKCRKIKKSSNGYVQPKPIHNYLKRSAPRLTRCLTSPQVKKPFKSSPPVLTRRMYMAFYARLAGMLFVSVSIILVLLSLLPFLFFHRKKWRLLIDHFQELWVNCLLWMLPQQQLKLSGDVPDASMRPKIVIANHQCDVDWVFMWMVARMTAGGRFDRSGSVKIMLKKDVKYLPIVGWGCVLFDFIFLARDWKTDAKTIEEKIVQLSSDGQPLWIFIFPEGTTVNQQSLEKSHAWAHDKNRPILNNLLLPRSRGLEHVLDVLNKRGTLPPELIDMTVAFEGYSGEVPTWEQAYNRSRDVLVPNVSKLLMGTSSPNISIECTRFCYRQLLRDEESLAQWLDNRWVRKSKLLKHFAEFGEFDPTECKSPISIRVTGSVWRSLAAVVFYVSSWAGMVFCYLKYSQEGSNLFR